MVLGPASAPRAEDPAPGKLYLASGEVKGSRQPGQAPEACAAVPCVSAVRNALRIALRSERCWGAAGGGSLVTSWGATGPQTPLGGLGNSRFGGGSRQGQACGG